MSVGGAFLIFICLLSGDGSEEEGRGRSSRCRLQVLAVSSSSMSIISEATFRFPMSSFIELKCVSRCCDREFEAEIEEVEGDKDGVPKDPWLVFAPP